MPDTTPPETKPILRALRGETLPTPPIWMMRQAGRYLPEYRATRAQAGDFLSLCYNSDLATEVTLQPIRRYGFDAAILFADILLLPQALGADLWFVTGEGPRLSTITDSAGVDALRPVAEIHETLNPVYQTVRNLAGALPPEVTLIGFAGAPWTVATYMIAGRGTPDQGPAHALKDADRPVFEALIDLLTEATVEYLSAQISAGGWLRAGQPQILAYGDGGGGADFRDAAHRGRAEWRAAYLQPRPRHHAGRRPRQRAAHDRRGAGRLTVGSRFQLWL
jgi:uroporphyrinogen decarboxylase